MPFGSDQADVSLMEAISPRFAGTETEIAIELSGRGAKMQLVQRATARATLQDR